MPRDVKPRPKSNPQKRKVLPEPILVPKKVTRIRDQNAILARILRDERISPHRALLAAFMHGYKSLGMKDGKEVPMTPQQQKDKDLYYNILVTQWGNPKSIQWLDREDAGPTDPPTAVNLDASDKLRVMFEETLRPAAKE